jgi:UDP-3-O-[3-hydroxymyristoyl] N-acetylglucosamine deacetylase
MPNDQQPTNYMQQNTIAATITQAGVGLHSGEKTQVRIIPASAGSGRYFVRVDFPHKLGQ